MDTCGYNLEHFSPHSCNNCKVAEIKDRSRPSPNTRFADMFPCENPLHPNYRNKCTRIESFESWPHHIKATDEELAEAGFFYCGEADRVKCFYCNGGLQYWDENDIPLLEHVKWFPHCEYVLQKVGFEEVAKTNAEFPDLRRPQVPQLSQARQRRRGTYRPESTNLSSENRTPSNNQSDTEQRNEVDLIAQAEQFGFEICAINFVVQKKRSETGIGYDNLLQLIEDLQIEEADRLSKNVSSYHETNTLNATATAQRVGADGLNGSTALGCMDLKDQLMSAMDETRCKICAKQERSCVFTSCGHMCCCYECGKDTKQCPLCKETVVKAIKIFKV